MSDFPRSPRLLKGAIVGADLFNPLASVVVFQYNPETLSRNVAVNAPAAAKTDVAPPRQKLRLTGPPRETISLTIELDASDALEVGDPLAGRMGVHSTLASLEMLLYPKSAYMIADWALSKAGALTILDREAPLTIFVWGPRRALPVEITDIKIEEKFFDPALNPVQATVTLTMTVLTYQDLGLASVGGALHMVHQVAKEVMASLNGAATVSALM